MASNRSRRASRTNLETITDPFSNMGSGLCLVIFCVFSVLSSLQSCEAQGIDTDIEGLMAFKVAADRTGVLNQSWIIGTYPCGSISAQAWLGIKCNDRGRVAFVNLSNLQLTGTFPENSLSRLRELRYLTVADNSFSGPFPNDLSNLSGLLQFWAQNARFSGPFPNISTVSERLAMVDLSGNNLTGLIPDLSGLTNLTMLDLSNNQFLGNIPPLPSSLNYLDLGGNFLTGTIPPDLAERFPSSSFAGNDGLCGQPTTIPCSISSGSSNSSVPIGDNDMSPSPSPAAGKKQSKKLSSVDIALMVGALALILTSLGFAIFFYVRERRKAAGNLSGKTMGMLSGKSISIDNSMSLSFTLESEKMKLSFFDASEGKYDLEDLLRASAEMLGKGSLGTAYKAVMENGTIVAVKRLRDINDMGKKEFDHHMEILGRLRHPNLVPLRAFYFATDERLLVYDFMPNGSLFSLLHGSRGPGRTPVDWASRLAIAQAVAQGLTYLHRECDSLKVPHGNIKSSNVLLGKNFKVHIADFGLVPLMSSTTATQRMAGYRAPECNNAKRVSHKTDVYSFGVLLLELLTGRQAARSVQGDGLDLPTWVQAVVKEEWTAEVFDLELKSCRHREEEMVSLLQVAMQCVMSNPDKRPEMVDVLEMIEGIRQVESVVDSEYLSRSNSNSSVEDNSAHQLSINSPSVSAMVWESPELATTTDIWSKGSDN